MRTSFPDQVHIDRIREALWSRLPFGNAAVLVGAGLSLNAKPAASSDETFPTWFQLAKKIVNHLYPEHEGASSEQRAQAIDQIKATSGSLRLAQEYQAAFGWVALDRLIAESIPDERFEPGDLHTLLLDLPWSDVFTTNWDTLLERCARKLLDRHYDLVRSIPEIPRSIKPRIVKLHGSLPSNPPFILTEEDFRTYPRRFAPFLNLAQQSMMENVFCLVGFSGDDLYLGGIGISVGGVELRP